MGGSATGGIFANVASKAPFTMRLYAQRPGGRSIRAGSDAPGQGSQAEARATRKNPFTASQHCAVRR
jgi:hypothetical protein